METRRQLIVQAQSGDATALGHLLAECQSDARRYAMRHCAVSEIDDAVQEALLIVSRHVGSLKNAASFAGWLFSIVRRECARLSRKMFQHESLEGDRVDAVLTTQSNESLRLELASAMESLPPHYLEIILLRDFEEMTISEIAQKLEISAASTKARLHRARALVREYLVEPTIDKRA
ncbi:MAG: sigma-70 family RNA polymerase sigma factor [Rhizobiales bacterium]|nr:sigma-70 family RNA polymerase sigma factor [Hyphomicrobiales bacterium]